MNKESVNWNLLGTGFELYNKTSGVETNGVEYIADNSYDYQKAMILTGKSHLMKLSVSEMKIPKCG